MQHTAQPTRPLADYLQNLSKEDLHRIRRTLDVKNASSLNKKELVECLSGHILAKLEDSLGLLDMSRYQTLQKVRDAGGSLGTERLFSDEPEGDSLYGLQDYGILFVDWKSKLASVPADVEERLQLLDQVWLRARVNRNTEWIQLTKGMLFYYGTVGFRQLLELISRYTNRPAEYSDYYDVIHDFCIYDEGLTLSAYGISYYLVDDPARISYEHEIRPTVDYYPFSKERILQAADDDYVDRSEAYRALVRFLQQHWSMSGEEADMIVEDLVYEIQLGSMPMDLLERLQSEIEISDMNLMQLLMDRLIVLMNHTRQWVLKGYSPNELSGKKEIPRNVQPPGPTLVPEPQAAEVFDFRTKKKIGRNDPCPCGSGKKFKKCCGA